MMLLGGWGVWSILFIKVEIELGQNVLNSLLKISKDVRRFGIALKVNE